MLMVFPRPLGICSWYQCIQVDEAVADIFGYHALQLGVPALDGLRANRMPHQWLATETLADNIAGVGGHTQTRPLDF